MSADRPPRNLGMIGKYTVMLYSPKRIEAIPFWLNTEDAAIEVCTYLLRSGAYYQILLYDPAGKLIATYKPE